MMARYSDKYPYAQVGYEPEHNLKRTDSSDPCYVCDGVDCWLDTEYSIYLCSDECFLRWQQNIAMIRRSDEQQRLH
jgi:hypothetical protein